jgi:uncharacterized protein DUF6448
MIIKRSIDAIVILVALVFGNQVAQAHCDSTDGPVAMAVRKALENGNVIPVLAYAPATAEIEIQTSFEKARKVRVLGVDARALSDRFFMETVIRLHRDGEAAPYTGVKPAGLDYGPVIPAADHAVQTGDLAKLKAVLVDEIEHELGERLTRVRALQKAPIEPQTTAEVPEARQRISAELEFVLSTTPTNGLLPRCA